MLGRDVTKTRVKRNVTKNTCLSKRASYRKSLDFVASFLQGNSFSFSIVLDIAEAKRVWESNPRIGSRILYLKKFFFKSICVISGHTQHFKKISENSYISRHGEINGVK